MLGGKMSIFKFDEGVCVCLCVCLKQVTRTAIKFR